VLTLGMGIRHGFGLFLQPMSADLGWGRETFALAMAVQNLMWGATQPFAGMLADKYGTARIVVLGALLYVLGLVTMAHAATPGMLVLTAGVLIGTGLSGLTFSIVAGVLGRRFPPEQRSMALGISAAAGSFGQFAMLPATQWLLSTLGWYGALVALGAVGLLMVPLALGLVERHAPSAHAFRQSAGEAMVEARSPERRITFRTRRRGEEVEVAIEDTGPGMAPEVRSRIFDPFFTGRRHGVGLGLALVFGIVAEHGGSIEVGDNTPTGTRFTIELPC